MIRRERLADGAVAALALALAYRIKRFYSEAAFDDLGWVLAPTAKLVEWMTGATFELEPHRGYLSRELLFEIVPSCAGINFLIASFCCLVCGLVQRRPTVRGKLIHLAVSGVAAYLLTLLANATRIAIGLRLHQTGWSWGALTPDRLHRIEGIAVYFLFLCLAFWSAARWVGPRHDPMSP